MKMQNPKDALFRDHLKCALQNVIWIHFRESSLQASFWWLPSSLSHCVAVTEAEHFHARTLGCPSGQCPMVPRGPAKGPDDGCANHSCVTSGRALRPREGLFPPLSDGDSNAFLTDLKELQKGSNKITKLVESSSFLFRITYLNIMCLAYLYIYLPHYNIVHSSNAIFLCILIIVGSHVNGMNYWL